MFGAGTDYALLIVSRFRDELRRDGRRRGGDARAAARTSPAILASGGIVVAAMLVLGLADFNATREMGPILALGIVVMMAAGLTLLPALLAAFGRRAFWPAIPRWSPTAGQARRAAGRGSARSCGAGRARWSLVCVAILVAGALGNLDGRGYLDLDRAVPRPPESVAGPAVDRASASRLDASRPSTWSSTGAATRRQGRARAAPAVASDSDTDSSRSTAT